MKLFDIFVNEYFAIMEHLLKQLKVQNDKILIDSNKFYVFLDKNLYLKRKDKLQIYKKLNLITCNSKGYTSVFYDKTTKKSQRKIILNLTTYKILKLMYETNLI